MCDCENLKIPERLWLKENPISNSFKDVSLYRRFTVTGNKNTWKSNNLSHCVFKLDKDSYNKSNLCKSHLDVLYNTREEELGNHYYSHGILMLNCSDLIDINKLPIELNGTERKFTLNPIHKPEKCMYPHSEILIYEGDVEIDIKTPKSINVLIRDILIEKMEVLKEPNIISELE